MKHISPGKFLVALIAAIGALAAIAPIAGADTPANGYTQFAGCPSPKTENPAVTSCLRSDITGGKIKIGNKSVPITQPLVLSGGTEVEGAGFVFNSKGGLSHTKLQVPGGVIGLTGLDWLVNFLKVEQLKLFAEAQLAGTPEVIGAENVRLPIKVHLINPVLGNNCYVGSNSSPIVLNLITGTSGKLTGQAPAYEFDPSLFILHARNGVFVDNTFSAPGASGCQLTLLGFIPVGLNSAVNLVSGLPAASGTNETVQNYNLEVAESNLVYP
jgi:hypothetical protein